MRPDVLAPSDVVSSALMRGRSRLLIRDALNGVALGAVVVALALAFGPVSGRTTVAAIGAGLVMAAGIVVMRRRARTPGEVARRLERIDPTLGNLIITAEELIRHPHRSAEWVKRRVFEDAAARVPAVDLGRAIPVGAAALAALTTIGLAALAPLAGRAAGGRAARALHGVAHGGPARATLDVRLEPPVYSKRPPVVLHEPQQIESLEATKLNLMIRPAGAAKVRFGDRPLPLTERAGVASAEMVLTQSGYLAIESNAGDPVRLVTVTVIPDRAPAVRVERPGRDLLLPKPDGAVDVDAAASDDIELGAMALRYTKVAGSGEQFEFVEGELPLAISRDTAQSWRGRGRIPIASLGLEAGDSLVYRVTARDGRVGSAGTASSDTFFIEIAGPGQVALEGFEMPPDQERYALSQQMIVIKLRRLREREKRLTASELDEQTGALAAEQRAIRANFVFLMGGHVEDEEEEAEQSHEIQEGRLENTARREISQAVSHMTTVEQALVAHDTSAALTAAIKAVESLQRAFTRNRYILRTLPSRLRIDPSRRLSGPLDEAKDGERPTIRATESPDTILARQLLADVIATLPRLRSATASAEVIAVLSRSAEHALAARPGDAGWTTIAQSLLRLRDDVSAGGAQARVQADARTVVQSLLQRVRRDAAVVREDATDRLESAWADEARRR